jgi:hypothetical protein
MRSPVLKIAALALLGSVPLSAAALDPGGALGDAAGAAAKGAEAAGAAAGGASRGAAEAAGAAVGGAARGTEAAGAAVGGSVAGATRGADDAVKGAAESVGGSARSGNPAAGLGGAVEAARGRGPDVGAPGTLGGSIGAGPAPAGAAAGTLDAGTGASGAAARPRPDGTRPGARPAAGTTGSVSRPALATVEEPATILRLPLVLAPIGPGRSGGEAERRVPGLGLVRGSERELRQISRPLAPRAGVPRSVVDACRSTIAAQARAHGAIRVEAVSAGPPRPVGEGMTGAPIEARILYSRGDQVQVRQARITCQLSARGQVVALV